MLRIHIAAVLLLASALAIAAARPAAAQQIVDRIVVRIGDDIITGSEVRELAAYQKLMDGQAQPEERLISDLIEQWVVNGEASAAQFPAATDAEVDREVARIADRFRNQQAANGKEPGAYEQRLAALELTRESVRRIVTRQLLLARYLDYKFRPAVQVEDTRIET